ncbi:MAG: 50S ribosomal protein L15 [Nitrososphaerota archaeon]|jgi:large subunit ribosomal protein L15|nr:50S ribosomal protein L15 [Nitrososphaerota archaeon]
MPHKLRKIRKTRGSRTQGYGRIGQHRDSGSKGNRKVGRHKHLWSKVVTSEPDYFGNHGFTSPRSLNRKEVTINIQKLVEIAETNTVDLTKMGYTKLLGTGKITKSLTITVPTCSKLAEEKVTRAGGKVITVSQANGE